MAACAHLIYMQMLWSTGTAFALARLGLRAAQQRHSAGKICITTAGPGVALQPLLSRTFASPVASKRLACVLRYAAASCRRQRKGVSKQ